MTAALAVLFIHQAEIYSRKMITNVKYRTLAAFNSKKVAVLEKKILRAKILTKTSFF